MNRNLRNALVVMILGAGSLALGNAGLVAFPDTGGGGGAQQVLRLASPTPTCTKTSAASRALRERQLIKSLEALGLAVH